MKPGTKIGIIITIVIIAMIVGAFSLVLFIAREKESIDAEKYKTIMEEKGYSVVDATSQFAEYNYVKKSYIATPEDRSYQIEFYELSDNDYAMKFFDSNKSIFEVSKSDKSVSKKQNGKNYSKYTISANERYNVVSRIDNTVIYVSVTDNHKDTIKDILKEIGY